MWAGQSVSPLSHARRVSGPGNDDYRTHKKRNVTEKRQEENIKHRKIFPISSRWKDFKEKKKYKHNSDNNEKKIIIKKAQNNSNNVTLLKRGIPEKNFYSDNNSNNPLDHDTNKAESDLCKRDKVFYHPSCMDNFKLYGKLYGKTQVFIVAIVESAIGKYATLLLKLEK